MLILSEALAKFLVNILNSLHDQQRRIRDLVTERGNATVCSQSFVNKNLPFFLCLAHLSLLVRLLHIRSLPFSFFTKKDGTMNCISFVFLLFASCLFGLSASLFPDSNPNFIGTAFGVPGKNVSFDYVVIGGGTAGITLATRLAQNGTFSVALVEAGSFYEISNGNHSAVPSGDIFFIGSSPQDYNPLVDWEIVTTPQAVSILAILLHRYPVRCYQLTSPRD